MKRDIKGRFSRVKEDLEETLSVLGLCFRILPFLIILIILIKNTRIWGSFYHTMDLLINANHGDCKVVCAAKDGL